MNACNVKGRLYCVSCDNNSHASWDRNCPEFMRRCAIYDDRNPENGMPYYPTDQDWTLTTHPERIPMELRYPGKYAVNSLPATNGRKKNQNPWGPWSKPKKPTRGVTERGKSNPNLIPLSQGRKEGEPSTGAGTENVTQKALDNHTDNTSKTLYHDTSEW